MGFDNLNIKIRYRSDDDDLVRDFIIPVLMETKLYKRSVGFFSTSALVDLTSGLFSMAERGGKVLLICSPYLSKEDIMAIDAGYKSRDEVILNSLSVSLTSPLSLFEEERLNLIATMIASGMLEMQLAFMESDTGINVYHEKIAICIDETGRKIGYTGSMNESINAFENNFESIFTFCSWKDASQIDALDKMESDFDNAWKDNTKKLRVVPFPQIIIDKLLKYKKPTVDYTTDTRQYGIQLSPPYATVFLKPEWVKMRDYQRRAVNAWMSQNCRGIFSMCTGAGKTFTALDAAVELAKPTHDKMAIFIVCPYIHLVSQWEEDVIQWCSLTPIIAHSKSTTPNWEERLKSACRRYRKEQRPFVCITTNDTFSGPKIQALVERFSLEDNVLFVVDEAHNFGAEKLSQIMPQQFNYRIALSATIERHLDRAGTARIFDFFGDECIIYGLEDAIKDNALVPYEYHPIPVYLELDELLQYSHLTKELKKYLTVDKDSGRLIISSAGQFIIYKRTRLLAAARNKIKLLLELMQDYKEKKNILVYCGATKNEDLETGEEERQIDLVTKLLRTEPLKMNVQRFTADEDLQTRQNIKEYFRDGLIQVITAIKCLDEGVNIPGIETAFILSSSRNPKEFIQRRGRLLRKSEGKEQAVIFDFVTLPRDLDNATKNDYESDRTILIGEMARIDEFGRLSKNPEEAEALKNRIMRSYDTFVDIEKEIKHQEEYYDNEQC